jgi:hypothetical protein
MDQSKNLFNVTFEKANPDEDAEGIVEFLNEVNKLC